MASKTETDNAFVNAEKAHTGDGARLLKTEPGFTPGRWFWKVDLNARQISLQSEGNMRQYVMDFKRWGNDGAPRFYKDGLMERGDSFAQVVPGREHHASWFQSLNHPDARLIAAAPALYDALTTLLRTETNLGGVSGIELLDAVDKARAALALVDGSQTTEEGK